MHLSVKLIKKSLLIFVALAIIATQSAIASDKGMTLDSKSSLAAKVDGKKRGHALIIGNSRYHFISPLSNPANDATDISATLERLGFDVTLIVDGIHRTMENEIFRFGRKLRKGGVGLFYFSGHGVQVAGRNYLIPIDANVDSESDIKFETVDAGRVLGKMEDAGNGINIIILDACRNNPFSNKFRTGDRGLAKMGAPTGSILAYSTAPGSVAADGEGRNGLYTSKLLKYIKEEGLSIEDCFKKVRIEVMEESGQKQVPWESSSLTADFYFLKPKTVQVLARDDSRSESAEILFWESIKDSEDVELYQFYIKQFPDGTFADLAKFNIQKYTRQSDTEDQRVQKPVTSRADLPKPTARKQPPKSEAPSKESLASIDENQVIKNKKSESHKKNNVSDAYSSIIESAGKSKLQNNTARSTVKIAFLPSLLEGIWEQFHSGPSAEQQYKLAIDAIEKMENVTLVYSYQNDPNSDTSKIWQKNNFFSVPTIDVDGVKQYCAGINADIALAIRSDDALTETYLIDVKSGKIISHLKGNFPHDIAAKLFKQQVVRAIRTFFAKR